MQRFPHKLCKYKNFGKLSLPFLTTAQHRKFVVHDITDIAVAIICLYTRITERLRGMQFPLSTIYTTYAHKILHASSNDPAYCSQLIIIS